MGKLLNRRFGFTLVEIMIVVVIIGLLAAIAIPAFLQSTSRSQATTLANDFRIYGNAFQMKATELGNWPADVNRGIIPVEMEGMLPKFTEPSVLGGNWDWDQGSAGYTAAVSLVGAKVSNTIAVKIDEILDNGNLASGRIVKDGNRIIYVLEE